ncbi:hypothetical protein [Streptomyces sp. NBC_00154]|uniref:hypothetical protein n=1 Tax=Streptomyces sp. NBC_00154 TaxID=2975670 RepID=UPI00225344CD|nr:hypothetical protein [Streptomyces sp. NBC_00154]
MRSPDGEVALVRVLEADRDRFVAVRRQVDGALRHLATGRDHATRPVGRAASDFQSVEDEGRRASDLLAALGEHPDAAAAEKEANRTAWSAANAP